MHKNNALVFISGQCNQKLTCLQVPDLFDLRLGPVSGIISSILWLVETHPEVKYCVFIPVDLVYLEWPDLSILMQAAQDIAYFENSPLPLVVQISATSLQTCRDVYKEMLSLSGYPVYKFIKKFKLSHEAPIVNPRCLTNLNYFIDWEEFIHEYSPG